MNTKVKGYFLGAIAAATYGTNPLFALPLYKDGMDPDSVLFFRYLFAIPILGMMIKGRGRSFKIEHKAAVPLIVLYFCYNGAVSYILNKFNVLTGVVDFIPVWQIYQTLLPISLGLGIGIGLIGSFFTTRKHLRV